MSMHYSGRPYRPPRRRQVDPSQACAEILGDHFRIFRMRAGRSLEELAPQVGLTAAELKAVEEGLLPIAWEQILLFAMVFCLGRSWMPYLMKLWAKAWPQ